jgi:hypothetical protein
MTATNVPNRPDPTRTGAVWVTGTGAFLLLAAAAVFTAVRWEHIPKSAKFGALVIATAAFLMAGRRLKANLPATAGALFHLGAFLVPIDVAALGMRAHLPGSTLLLLEGLAATVTFGWASAAERSVVLRWAAAGSVVALAGGIGATTPLPAALVLVAGAVAAHRLHRDEAALAWAVVVALAPVAALIERAAVTGPTVSGWLGLAPGHQPLAAAAGALCAAGIVGAVAQRRGQADLALVGIVLGAAGAAASWAGVHPQPEQVALALAGGFLCLQAVAIALREDAFWKLPVTVLTDVAERAAGIGLVLLAGRALDSWALRSTDPSLALTAVLLGASWVIADRRRGPAGLRLASTITATCTIAAVVGLGASPLVLATALAGVAAASVLADRSDAALVAVAAAVGAPFVAMATPACAGLLGGAGALILGEAAVRRSRRASADPVVARATEDAATGLSLAGLVPLVVGGWAVVDATGWVAVTLAAGAVAAAALAAWVDRGVPQRGLPLGTVVRVMSVGVLLGVAQLPAAQVAAVAAAVAIVSVADAVRLRLPVLALGASLAGPIAIGAFVRSTGLSLPATGVALTVSAVVLAGLGSLLGARWSTPVAAAVATALAGGVLLAAGDPTALANALMIAGGMGLAASVALDRTDGMLASGTIISVGLWIHLGLAHVHASEPYLLPVAALLLVAGARLRGTQPASSWVAYGPAVALVGGAGFAERVDGGAGWHAVLAGAVGVLAVLAGGHRRLAGPLLLGTGLLVALAGYETLAITAGLPTWTWLAAGGATLLAAGVGMERHDVGPIETGRRLVDVVGERFT